MQKASKRPKLGALLAKLKGLQSTTVPDHTRPASPEERRRESTASHQMRPLPSLHKPSRPSIAQPPRGRVRESIPEIDPSIVTTGPAVAPRPSEMIQSTPMMPILDDAYVNPAEARALASAPEIDGPPGSRKPTSPLAVQPPMTGPSPAAPPRRSMQQGVSMAGGPGSQPSSVIKLNAPAAPPRPSVDIRPGSGAPSRKPSGQLPAYLQPKRRPSEDFKNNGYDLSLPSGKLSSASSVDKGVQKQMNMVSDDMLDVLVSQLNTDEEQRRQSIMMSDKLLGMMEDSVDKSAAPVSDAAKITKNLLEVRG